MLDFILQNITIILLFFAIAVLYSSVGFGGGSSYLAVLAISGIFFTQIRATALLCNIMVVTGNVYLYQRKNSIDWKKILPLVLVSVPLALLGGYVRITEQVFFILLGITLFFAAFSMWISNKVQHTSKPIGKSKTKQNSIIGGLIGFVSGMVGIGGGIFLSPVLHLSYWDSPKKIAATSSVFILFNSVFGLLGQTINPDFEIDWKLTSILMFVVLVGGQIGNRLSHRFFTPLQLKRATAILIAFVSLRILWKTMF